MGGRSAAALTVFSIRTHIEITVNRVTDLISELLLGIQTFKLSRAYELLIQSSRSRGPASRDIPVGRFTHPCVHTTLGHPCTSS